MKQQSLHQQIESKLLLESMELEKFWKNDPLLKIKQKVQPRRLSKKNQPSLLTMLDVVDIMLTSDS